MNRSIIFHCPFPLLEQQKSGSQVRPVQMLTAFRQLGYNVEVVTGYERERAVAIANIKADLSAGRKFDFVYSESATVPTLLTERLRHHRHPSLDFAFWHRLKRDAVPIGLFYRDIYWRTNYKFVLSWRKRLLTTPLYWYDWFCYQFLVDQLFLPSLEMTTYLPTRWPPERLHALPPGCNKIDLPPVVNHDSEQSPALHLFYVGSVVLPFYDLRPVIELISSLNNISLTICCRSEEWEQWQAYYLPIRTERVRIVHASGEQLHAYYAAADAFLLIWQPNPYLEFAMPVKVFESIGYGLPIIVNEGLRVSRFITEENLGWITVDMADLRNLLVHLATHHKELYKKREHLRRARERHTWLVRAQTVAHAMDSQSRRADQP